MEEQRKRPQNRFTAYRPSIILSHTNNFFFSNFAISHICIVSKRPADLFDNLYRNTLLNCFRSTLYIQMQHKHLYLREVRSVIHKKYLQKIDMDLLRTNEDDKKVQTSDKQVARMKEEITQLRFVSRKRPLQPTAGIMLIQNKQATKYNDRYNICVVGYRVFCNSRCKTAHSSGSCFYLIQERREK